VGSYFLRKEPIVQVPLFDLTAQYRELEPEILPAIQAFLPRQQLILGETVERFEKNLAVYCGSKYAVGVSSGTDALLIALEAMDIGPGDEVIVPAFTFYCTASVVVRRGATPVFVDVAMDDFNALPEAIAAAITPRTKAIIPVHLFGQSASLDKILKIAEERGIPVLEDGAQAIGAEFNGQRVGSLGRFGAFSFFPTKNLGAFGDGGAVTMNTEADYLRVKSLRMHGSRERYKHEDIGGCYRLDALQALVLDIKLKHLDRWHAARQANAAAYASGLAGVGDLILPVTQAGRRHIFNQYVVRTAKRDALRTHLQQLGIGSEIYYPSTIPSQESFRKLGLSFGTFPNAERLCGEVLALPVFPELRNEQRDAVVAGIRSFF
jgi:dTDP-4-amino-4,6-dideoxygalactose transaminase